MGKTPDHFAQAWAAREWGIEGIHEEATARRWFEKGMRVGMERACEIAETRIHIGVHLEHARMGMGGTTMTPTQDLCERLRLAATSWHPACDEAADFIEAQAAQIAELSAKVQQQALEYTSLFDQCSEALAKVAELQAQLERSGRAQPIDMIGEGE